MEKELIMTLAFLTIWNVTCILFLLRKINKVEKGMLLYIASVFFFTLLALLYLEKSNAEYCALYYLKDIGLLSLLFCIAPIDFKQYKIPNNFILLGLSFRAALLIGEFIMQREVVVQILLSELAAVLIIAAITLGCMLYAKNSIGAGDVKLMLLMCLFQGIERIGETLIISALVSLIFVICLPLVKRMERKTHIPMAPSFLIGTYLSIFLMS